MQTPVSCGGRLFSHSFIQALGFFPPCRAEFSWACASLGNSNNSSSVKIDRSLVPMALLILLRQARTPLTEPLSTQAELTPEERISIGIDPLDMDNRKVFGGRGRKQR